MTASIPMTVIVPFHEKVACRRGWADRLRHACGRKPIGMVAILKNGRLMK